MILEQLVEQKKILGHELLLGKAETVKYVLKLQQGKLLVDQLMVLIRVMVEQLLEQGMKLV